MSLSFVINGPLWRALFVAGLALISFVLERYWRRLEGQRTRVRLTLVSLRGAALLLLLCALVGMRVEDESSLRSKVLIRRAFAAGSDAHEPDSNRLAAEQAVRRTLSVLKAKGVESVERAEEEDATLTDATPEARPDDEFGAALLLTDGALSVDEAEREVERVSVASGGAPVFVLTGLSRSEEPEVALESVAVTGAAMRGVPMALRAVVHGRGMRGRESLLTVADNAKVQASAKVLWASDDEWQTVALEVVPKVSGWTDYTLRVEAAREGSRATLSRALTVYAEERRLRVLFFEGEPTWESKFIRRALEQSGLFDVDYFAQVSRAAVAGATVKAEGRGGAEPDGEQAPTTGGGAKGAGKNEAAPEARLHAALSSESLLNAYHCVIAGATPDTMLSAAEGARLQLWVERRGGGLIILGGNSFAGSIVAPRGKLSSLLPAEVDQRGFASQTQQVARGGPVEAEKARASITLLPTGAGADGALGGYLSSSEGLTKLGALTGEGLRLGALSPAATVLAVGAQSNLVSVSETGAPLVVAMRDGEGRALVFAPSDSWRLRTSASGNEAEPGGPFDALWQGLVLWSAAGSRPPIELVLNDVSPASGDEVVAEIRARDAAFAPLKIERLSARLQTLPEDAANAAPSQTTNDGRTQGADDGPRATDDGEAREVAFMPDGVEAHVWRARFIAPSRGRFALTVEYLAGGKSGSTEKYFAVVRPSSPEAGAARDTLGRLARETGGELFDDANTDALAARLDALPGHPESVRREQDLRTFWPLAFLIPLLLSLEWFVRRWKIGEL